MNYSDPSGHFAISAIIGGIALAIGVVATVAYNVQQTIKTQQYINENYSKLLNNEFSDDFYFDGW